MLMLIIGIAIGAAFSPFWMAVYAKIKSFFTTVETDVSAVGTAATTAEADVAAVKTEVANLAEDVKKL